MMAACVFFFAWACQDVHRISFCPARPQDIDEWRDWHYYPTLTNSHLSCHTYPPPFMTHLNAPPHSYKQLIAHKYTCQVARTHAICDTIIVSRHTYARHTYTLLHVDTFALSHMASTSRGTRANYSSHAKHQVPLIKWVMTTHIHTFDLTHGLYARGGENRLVVIGGVVVIEDEGEPLHFSLIRTGCCLGLGSAPGNLIEPHKPIISYFAWSLFQHEHVHMYSHIFINVRISLRWLKRFTMQRAITTGRGWIFVGMDCSAFDRDDTGQVHSTAQRKCSTTKIDNICYFFDSWL